MTSYWLGTRPMFIDQEGTLGVQPATLAAVSGKFADRQQLAEYAVKNLDLVRVWCGTRGLRVQFRPDRISANALTQLLYLLSETPDTRVGFDYFRDGWHHELVGNGHAAIARVVALVEEARIDATGSVLAELVDPAALSAHNPLHDLIENWRARVRWREFALFIDRACERSGGRFVLFEYDRDRGAFVFQDFGAGIPEWAKHSLANFRGRALADLHADQFGRSCTFAYGEALEKFSPTVQVVDANIRWPGYGTLRSCYWRLMLPMTDPAGRFWLLSASLADAAIDLRKTG